MLPIYIPTRNRVGQQLTVQNLPDSVHPHVFLVCPEAEVPLHRKTLGKGCRINYMPRPNDLKGCQRARQFITDNCDHPTFLQLDDDLEFAVRVCQGDWRLRPCEETDIHRMIYEIEQLLELFMAVGISARQGNNHTLSEYMFHTRMTNAYAFRKEFFTRHPDIRWDTMELMEDFYVTLHMLRLGYANAVLFKYCWNQKASNAPGGCADIRTGQMQAECARELARVHHGFVRVVDKKSKSVWKGMETRTDVIIQWWKAYQSSAKKG